MSATLSQIIVSCSSNWWRFVSSVKSLKQPSAIYSHLRVYISAYEEISPLILPIPAKWEGCRLVLDPEYSTVHSTYSRSEPEQNGMLRAKAGKKMRGSSGYLES